MLVNPNFDDARSSNAAEYREDPDRYNATGMQFLHGLDLNSQRVDQEVCEEIRASLLILCICSLFVVLFGISIKQILNLCMQLGKNILNLHHNNDDKGHTLFTKQTCSFIPSDN